MLRNRDLFIIEIVTSIFKLFQVNEYKRLKTEALRQSGIQLQNLEKVNREQKTDQDRLDNETRRRNDLQNRLVQKQHELAEAEKRLEKLVEHIR